MTGTAFCIVPREHAIVFRATEEFRATHDAEALLKQAGFSIGPTQRGAPRAVMFGDYLVAKWRGLNHDQRRKTHGTLTGDNRHGPLMFRLLPAAPDAAIEAIRKATSA